MWHKPCRTFNPWCLCIKTRCLVPWTVHSANEVTPCRDWAWVALVSAQVAGTRSGSRGHRHRAGHHPERDPALAARRISPIKHCQVAQTSKHIHHRRWWRFPMCIYFIFPKHDAVKIFFCLDIGIWHILHWNMHVASSYFFANCSLGTFQLD